MIKVLNLKKKYGDFVALKEISFELKEGEVVGLLGPNGAGKTTLLRILASFLKPTAGYVEIEGMEIGKPMLEQKIKNKIGYLPEQAPLYEDMLVSEYLDFIGKMQGVREDALGEKVSAVMAKCGLSEKKNAEISTLSKGYRQRVGIAQALIHNPKIVILDEPTTGLDPNQRIEIRDLIKEIGKDHMVILSSHILSEVRSTCSRVIIISKGRIVADGSLEDLEKKGRGNTIIKIEVQNVVAGLLEGLENLAGIANVKLDGNMIELEVREEGARQVAEIADIEIGSGENKVEILNIEQKDGADIRSQVAQVAVESGAGLLALKRKQTSLEDIFINLTSKEDE